MARNIHIHIYISADERLHNTPFDRVNANTSTPPALPIYIYIYIFIIYGACTVYLAGKSPYLRCKYTVLAIPNALMHGVIGNLTSIFGGAIKFSAFASRSSHRLPLTYIVVQAGVFSLLGSWHE